MGRISIYRCIENGQLCTCRINGGLDIVFGTKSWTLTGSLMWVNCQCMEKDILSVTWLRDVKAGQMFSWKSYPERKVTVKSALQYRKNTCYWQGVLFPQNISWLIFNKYDTTRWSTLDMGCKIHYLASGSVPYCVLFDDCQRQGEIQPQLRISSKN